MQDTAVSLGNLTFNYGNLRVIDDVCLQIPKGISFGLLGSNGAGKTTLIRLMVGLLKPSSGDIACLSKAPSPSNAKNVGYMPQLPALYSELTPRQNIDFFAHVYGMRDRRKRAERVDEIIRVVDLLPKRDVQVAKLSGGMRQRVSLGCAIVHNPPLLFLDEPTVGLDPELRAYFWDYFEGLTRNGTTLVISSHTMDDASHCQQLVFMRDGRLIAQGSPAELRRAVGTRDASLEDAFLYFIRHREVTSDVQ